MINPIIKNRNIILAYVVIWAIIIPIQSLVINFFYGVDGNISIYDSAIFNLLYAVLGFNLWYIIRFNLKERKNIFDLLLNHFMVATISISAWITISYFTLIYIFPDSTSYREFLNESIPWRVITGVFYYLLFVMYYNVMIYYEDLQDKLRIEAQLQGLVNEAELLALKSQINPHFLFNSLNSISSLTISNPDKAQEMVIKLSDFLRYTLRHDKDEKASFQEELNNLQRYLDIEKIRFGNRLNFISHISEKCTSFQIPNMILQPLIENAIKHGVYDSTEEVLVELKCDNDEEYITIEILNEYDPDSINKKGNGIGLKNIQKRLQIIYGRQDLFSTSVDNMVFKAALKLPINP